MEKKEFLNNVLEECKRIFMENGEIQFGEQSETDYATYFSYEPELEIAYSCTKLNECNVFDDWIDAEPVMYKACCIEDALNIHEEKIKEEIDFAFDNAVDDYDGTEQELINEGVQNFIDYCWIQ